MKRYIGIDIGGTAVKYGVVSEKGAVENDGTDKTGADGAQSLIENVCCRIKALLRDCPGIEGIGISTAGIVDPLTGAVVYSNNIPGYRGTDWRAVLEKFRLPVSVQNDVNAAALAEAWLGAARGCHSFFCMTIGTGIGGALFLNDRLYAGGHGYAGEIGYLGTAGDNAWFEQKASTSKLVLKVEEELHVQYTDGILVFQKARSGDPEYNLILNGWIDEIAKGIANVICLIDPEAIVIGGGISREKDYLLDKIESALQKILPDPFQGKTPLRAAECGNQAGLIGSVYELADPGK